MNKKNLLIGSALVLAALLVVGGTMAWFTADADPIINTFTAGTVEIVLRDNFPTDGIENVNPGDEYEKIVYVENTGTKAVYVRVKLTPEWSGLPEGFEPDDEVVILGSLGDDWEKHGDWYYYKNPLAGAVAGEANAVTTHLIEKVEFAGPEMTNDYQGATFTLKVEAEAVQASHGAAEDLWELEEDFLNPYPPTP